MESDASTQTTQYLSFTLGGEIFAFDISKVREVLDLAVITTVPRMPGYMLGVINLRGGVVAVVDMRLKFGMSHTERTVNTCIIIVEVSIDSEKMIIGALADSVKEVFDMNASEIEPAPRIGTQLDTYFLRGVGKHNDQFVLVLDIDHVFTNAELSELAEHDASGRLENQAA